ncbi:MULTISPECIES: hypothetical protein [unclassified Myroides]|uniref:hypothetical protein n=1 Tax=unclassified Myroides TaxID=2642485 RepID=UPI003D2F6940
MYKLTEHQLQHIDQFLVAHYRLYYIDLRAEVVDYIATAIEMERRKEVSYEEAFVLVMAKWDALLKPAKGFFRGIPCFVAEQWRKERIRLGGKALLFGVLTTLLYGGLFHRLLDSDLGNWLSLSFFALLFLSGIVVYIHNFNLVKKTALHTATGSFLRIEFKRLGLVQSTFAVLTLLSQLKLMPKGDWYIYTYILMGSIALFYMVHWRIDYQKEKLYQIKWNTI